MNPKNKPKTTIRLNRYLAQAGVSSRRKADEYILAGRISVDGKIIKELGTQVFPGVNKILVDGVALSKPSSRLLYFLLYKPKNTVTTVSDPEGRPTVMDYFSRFSKDRLFPVGRLDFDSEGALLMTNDGDLTHQLTHPKFQIQKEYLVKVKEKPSKETLEKMKKGFKLEDGFFQPQKISFVRETKENSWYRLIITEGRNHLVKRFWLRAGHPVIKLIRTSFAGISLGQLRPGEIRPLTKSEVQALKAKTKARKEV